MNVKDIPLAYFERAVWDNPRGAEEKPWAYVARIAGIVAGTEGPAVKAMPDVRLPYREAE